MDERIKMLISAYHDGELAGEEEAEIRAYIKREEDAQAYLGSLQEISTAISTLPVESAPPEFSQRLISRLELTDQVAAAKATTANAAQIHKLDDHRAPKTSGAKVICLRDRSWYPAAVAAILVLAVVGGTILIDKSLENAALERERRLADNPDVTNTNTGSALERLNNHDGNHRGSRTESAIETTTPALPPENAETGDHTASETVMDAPGEKVGAKSPSPIKTPGAPAEGNVWRSGGPDSKEGDGRAVDIAKPTSASAGLVLDDAALRTAIQTNQTVTISLPDSALSLGDFGGTLTKTLVNREVPLRTLDWKALATELETADSAPTAARTGGGDGTDTGKSDPASPRPGASGDIPPSLPAPAAEPGGNGLAPKPAPGAKDDDAPAPADRESVRRRDTPASGDDGNSASQPATEAAAVATIFVLGRVTAEDGKGEYVLLDLPESKTADVVRALHDLSGTVNGTFTIDDVLHRVLEGRKAGAESGTIPSAPKRDGETETAKESADRPRPDARTRLVVKLVPK